MSATDQTARARRRGFALTPVVQARLADGRDVEITVPSDHDEDDCLAAAEATYIDDHSALAGWNLYPRWDADHDGVLLIVPAWALEETDR
jgi:hypothetical protein